jgi:hypothetical protein
MMRRPGTVIAHTTGFDERNQNKNMVTTGDKVTKPDPPPWLVAWELVVDLVLGTGCFVALVYATCVGSLHIDLLHTMETDLLMIWILTLVKYAAFVGEVALYLKYLWASFARAWKRL